MRAELPDYNDYSYPHIPDHVDRLNDNAYVLATLCIDKKFVVVNNLRVRENEFTSSVTYKQSDVWISEMDMCMTASNMVDHIDEFSVHQTDFLPSDHAPISLQLSMPIQQSLSTCRTCHTETLKPQCISKETHYLVTC